MSLPFNAWRSDQLSQATSSIVNKTWKWEDQVEEADKKERRMERGTEEWTHAILIDVLQR